MISFEPIGAIYTPFKAVENMPIQAAAAAGCKGRVIIKEKFASGLKDLDGFSHAHLIYAFHECKGYLLEVKPFLDDVTRGIFATRSPKRPCHIGMSIVRITGINGVEISVENVDMLDGTPLLDIKPYVPEFDVIDEAVKTGWYQNKPKNLNDTRSDGRFK